MGAIAEVARSWPGARRSSHPQVSFAAVGPAADRIVGHHDLAYGLGERSPLARLYEVDALVLLLGVGHDRNTSLHLAQYRSQTRSEVRQAGPVVVDGVRRWTDWPDIDLDDDDFAGLGREFREAEGVRMGTVGRASVELMRSFAVRALASRPATGTAGVCRQEGTGTAAGQSSSIRPHG